MNFQMLVEIAEYVSENYGALIVSINGVLGFFIGLFLLIPGNQPEKFLQSIVDLLSKYSKK